MTALGARKWLGCGLVAALALAADQGVKRWVLDAVGPGGESRALGGLLVIAPREQAGAALGLLERLDPVWGARLLWALAALGALALAQLLWRAPRGDLWSGLAAGLILGGAAGNLCDRLASGAVLEYARLELRVLPLPEFNLADCAIAAGLGLLLLDWVAFESAARTAPE